jgi:hypothetical protein
MANPFFDAAYYLARNPDVVAAGYTLATAEQHYLRYGAVESLTDPSRAPNAWFDARAYLAAYPDLVANGVTAATAFSHYVNHGINENRSPAANINPADFSYATYAAANADLRTPRWRLRWRRSRPKSAMPISTPYLRSTPRPISLIRVTAPTRTRSSNW